MTEKITLRSLNLAHHLVTGRENGDNGTRYPLKTGYWPADIVRVGRNIDDMKERIRDVEELLRVAKMTTRDGL